MNMLDWAERGWLPDGVVRFGIRRLLNARLTAHQLGGIETQTDRFRELLEELRESPVAIETDAANQQHYEVAAELYQHTLGKRLKYSCALWQPDCGDLDQAEIAMLQCYGERAQLSDGQRVLELGCGWGSLTLWMAEQFPGSHITGVSNSASQREYILSQAAERGLSNIEIITADVNFFVPSAPPYDRVVSIEMFEHMRNYQTLMQRISDWLTPDGFLFVHIFCHHRLMYPFEVDSNTGSNREQGDWMGRYFFTGGLMPSLDTLMHFQQHLRLKDFWAVDGRHYEKTSNAWLQNLDRNSRDVKRVCEQVYGAEQGKLWAQRWRMFFMACAELFGYRDGREWLVAHYLFRPR